MLNQAIKTKRILLFTGLVLVAGILLALKLTVKPTPFLIVNTNPNDRDVNVSSETPISLTFNQPVSASFFTIKTNPEFKFNLTQDNTTITLTPTIPLYYETDYLIEISTPDGFYSAFRFTTTKAPILPTPQPSGRGDETIMQDIITGQQINYPLKAQTPLITDNWSIDYLKPLTLIVTLKSDTPEIRQEVLDWIESKGVDPASHTFIWKLKK